MATTGVAAPARAGPEHEAVARRRIADESSARRSQRTAAHSPRPRRQLCRQRARLVGTAADQRLGNRADGGLSARWIRDLAASSRHCASASSGKPVARTPLIAATNTLASQSTSSVTLGQTGKRPRRRPPAPCASAHRASPSTGAAQSADELDAASPLRQLHVIDGNTARQQSCCKLQRRAPPRRACC